jgi:nitrogen regulatory protein PII
MTATKQTIYTHGKLLISLVERHTGEKLVAATKRAGARGGTIILGRGTAESSLLESLGIGDSEKDVVLTLATDEQTGPIMAALRSSEMRERHIRGVAMLVDVANILRHVRSDEADSVSSAERRSPMKTQDDHVLITFIVNRGYADDAMQAARKAGAKGGTILNARGTGNEEDVKFFGISLVPEKEILLILVEAAQSDAVLQAVRQVPCLAEPGSGIAFCIAVEDFIALGTRTDDQR